MLVAISAAHGRHAVTRAWAEHTKSLGFGLIVMALTRDEPNRPLLSLAQTGSLLPVLLPNDPLSGKFNGALDEAMSHGATRIMILPSDDFVSHEWVEAARNSTEDYIIPHTCAIADAYTQHAYNITKLSLNPGATMKFGAGRVVSRRVVEACDGKLWPDELNRGLDGASHARINKAGFKVKVVETPGIPITDLKTDENIWGYRTWESSGRTIHIDEALHMVSSSVRAQIDAMKR